MHINKLDDSKYKESSEESSLPRLRGRLLQSCRAHCLSSKAQTCCGQPVLPLVFLSLLLTVLFKISFWGDRMRRERKRERETEGGEEKKRLEVFLPFLGRLCPALRGKNYEEKRAAAAASGLQGTKRAASPGSRRGRSRRPWERSRLVRGRPPSPAEAEPCPALPPLPFPGRTPGLRGTGSGLEAERRQSSAGRWGLR